MEQAHIMKPPPSCLAVTCFAASYTCRLDYKQTSLFWCHLKVMLVLLDEDLQN